MADKPKLVRLTNPETGITVETTEENAERLRGYEPEKTTAKRASSSKSSK